MIQQERIVLTQENLEDLGEKLKQFFMMNGIPVYEETYINTTMESALDSNYEGKNHCGTLKFKAQKVDIMESNKKPGLTLHFWDYDKNNTPGYHWFELGTEFAFEKEHFFVKSPCKDYVTNRYDYTLRIFRACS